MPRLKLKSRNLQVMRNNEEQGKQISDSQRKYEEEQRIRAANKMACEQEKWQQTSKKDKRLETPISDQGQVH